MRRPLVNRTGKRCGILVAVLSLISTSAFAVVVPAFPGGEVNSSCVTRTGVGVVSNCSSALFTIFIPANSGPHTVTVSTYNPADWGFFCALRTVDTQGNFSLEPWQPIPTGNATTPLTLTVPTGGVLDLECEIPQSGEVFTVNYTE